MFIELLRMATGATHKHRCPNCDTIFEHPDLVALADKITHDEAHTCPRCGEPNVNRKYYGRRPANYHQHDERGY